MSGELIDDNSWGWRERKTKGNYVDNLPNPRGEAHNLLLILSTNPDKSKTFSRVRIFFTKLKDTFRLID